VSLRGFNNVPMTTFDDVKAVLREATRRLEAKLGATLR
jgi:hypothetical protein